MLADSQTAAPSRAQTTVLGLQHQREVSSVIIRLQERQHNTEGALLRA